MARVCFTTVWVAASILVVACGKGDAEHSKKTPVVSGSLVVPAANPVPVPVAKPKPTVASEPTAEPDSLPEVEPNIAPKPEPKVAPEADLRVKVKAKVAPGADLRAKGKVDSKAKVKAKGKIAPKPESKVIVAPKPEPKVIVAPKPEPKVIVAPKPEPKVIVAPKPEPKVIDKSMYAAKVTKKVERKWRAKCASCHGKDGRGKTEQGAKMGIRSMRTLPWQRGHSDSDIRNIAIKGINRTKDGKKQEMKSFKGKLSGADLDGLIALIRVKFAP